MEASGAKNFDTELFTTTCQKISKVPALTTKTEYCSVPSSTKCDRVDVTLEGWSSNLDIDLSTTVFKYNPVSFSGIKTGDGLIDGIEVKNKEALANPEVLNEFRNLNELKD